MKKIAIVCHDHSLSGANQSLLDYLKCANHREYDITVFFPMRKKSKMTDALEKLGIKHYCYKMFVLVKQLSKKSAKCRIKESIKHIYNFFFKANAYKKMRRYIKENKFDIVISNSFAVLYGAQIARDLNIRHIFHVREFMETDHQITHYNFENVTKLCENSEVVFISHAIEKYYLDKYYFKKLKVVYDRIAFERTFKKRKLFLEGNELRLLIAGTMQPNKGQMDAIQAVELLTNKINVKLYICGQGPDENKLRRYCKEKELNNVIFTGQLTPEQLLKLREEIDISLVCSRMEALGRVTVESMFYKSLTIGSNSGETAYLLSDNRGYLYEFGNAHELAERIMYALEHVSEVEKVIKTANEFALESFSKNIFDEIITDLEDMK